MGFQIEDLGAGVEALFWLGNDDGVVAVDDDDAAAVAVLLLWTVVVCFFLPSKWPVLFFFACMICEWPPGG